MKSSSHHSAGLWRALVAGGILMTAARAHHRHRHRAEDGQADGPGVREGRRRTRHGRRHGFAPGESQPGDGSAAEVVFRTFFERAEPSGPEDSTSPRPGHRHRDHDASADEFARLLLTVLDRTEEARHALRAALLRHRSERPDSGERDRSDGSAWV